MPVRPLPCRLAVIFDSELELTAILWLIIVGESDGKKKSFAGKQFPAKDLD
jgi:hypothetical protein